MIHQRRVESTAYDLPLARYDRQHITDIERIHRRRLNTASDVQQPVLHNTRRFILASRRERRNVGQPAIGGEAVHLACDHTRLAEIEQDQVLILHGIAKRRQTVRKPKVQLNRSADQAIVKLQRRQGHAVNHQATGIATARNIQMVAVLCIKLARKQVIVEVGRDEIGECLLGMIETHHLTAGIIKFRLSSDQNGPIVALIIADRHRVGRARQQGLASGPLIEAV
mmetsp:Transcript_24152/g.38817  ORF Transcript_24152/g.38817 Transcript_24152/m.38817 type:complete len:225 (-) Transcript_24152:100-774(-)